jgi:hypothetical protein
VEIRTSEHGNYEVFKGDMSWRTEKRNELLDEISFHCEYMRKQQAPPKDAAWRKKQLARLAKKRVGCQDALIAGAINADEFSWCMKQIAQNVQEVEATAAAVAAIDPVRSRIEWMIASFHSRGYLVSVFRDVISKTVGRILINGDEADKYLGEYSGLWRPGERPSLNGLNPICYGHMWKQRWYVLRDLVAPTRRVRARARPKRLAANFCSICRGRIVRLGWDEWPDNEDLLQIIRRRHYTTPGWEFGPQRSSRDRSRELVHDVTRHFQSLKAEPKPVCSVSCAATRFSRWYGAEAWQNRKDIKEWNRQRKEREWNRRANKELQAAKQGLLAVRGYLNKPSSERSHPEAWQSQSAESEAAGISPT